MNCQFRAKIGQQTRLAHSTVKFHVLASVETFVIIPKAFEHTAAINRPRATRIHSSLEICGVNIGTIAVTQKGRTSMRNSLLEGRSALHGQRLRPAKAIRSRPFEQLRRVPQHCLARNMAMAVDEKNIIPAGVACSYVATCAR